VYLPDGYAGGKDRYPVIYMLHGYGDTEDRMIFMADTLHRAITAGLVPKVIMVFPNGGKQTFYCDYSVWPWTKGIDADSYVAKELIPYIDSAYRTAGSREGRLLQGFSMGGWGSLHFALKYPQLFSRVCALSPGGRNVDSLDNPTALSTRNAEAIKSGSKIRMVAGGADALKKEADAFDALWTKLGIVHEYEVVPNAKHSPETIYGATGVKDLVFLTRNLSVNTRPASGAAAPGLSLEPGPAGAVRIRFGMPAAAQGTLEVYGRNGALVKTLARGRFTQGGHEAAWDFTDEKRSALPRSCYVVVLRTGGLTRSLVVPYL
jgi:S-formylglutathione hydrolase FrmB